MTDNKCPKCGAPLQEGARFCPRCMTQFDKKEEIKPGRQKTGRNRKILLAVISVVLVMALAGTGVLLFLNRGDHSPICSFPQLCVASVKVTRRMGIGSLWNPESLKDIKEFKKEKLMLYSAETTLDGATLFISFYNFGEKIYAYICDLKPEEEEKGNEILKCIIQSSSNYYFEEIDDIFTNESLYPREDLDYPFDEEITDPLMRTETYKRDIENGAQIATKYLPIKYTNEAVGDVVVFIGRTQRDYENGTLLDLSLVIERL